MTQLFLKERDPKTVSPISQLANMLAQELLQVFLVCGCELKHKMYVKLSTEMLQHLRL